MLRLKRLYKTRLCPDFWLNFEPSASEDQHLEEEHPEHQRDDMIAAYYRKISGEDEAIQIEACRGWCSWGF